MKKILLGFIAMLISTISFSQKIHFNYKDSTKSSYDLEDVRKITFDGDLMNLHLLDGSLYAWNVSTIGHYKYEETFLITQDLTVTQELLNKANAWNLSVFPNPTSTNLNVNFNLPKADKMSIALYDFQGKVVLEKQLGTKAIGKHQETLNISNLPNGVYVCRITGVHNLITKQIIKK